VRILFVSPYPPERDGIGAYCAMLTRALTEQGHEVAVITPRPSASPPPEVIGSLPRARASSDDVVAAARSFAPDVVHIQFAVAAYGAQLPSARRTVDALRRHGYPVVITMHEVTRDTETLRAPGVALYRRVAARASQLIVHTDVARRAIARIIDRNPVPVSQIPHPRTELPPSDVPPHDLRERFSLGGDRVVLAFGFIDVDKGLDDLVAAMGLMSAEGGLSGLRVVVAGDVRRRFGAFRLFELRDRRHLRKVKRLAADLQLQDRVVFAGFVPEAEIRTWFELANVAVLPYRRSEQSGVASLAAAAGTPLITTEVGELAALSAMAPVPPRDPRALAARLREFLDDAGARDSRVEAPGGDLPEIAERTALLYREVAGDPRAALVTA
jgi:glycosyltransferase involved in cell wall biosynthesis